MNRRRIFHLNVDCLRSRGTTFFSCKATALFSAARDGKMITFCRLNLDLIHCGVVHAAIEVVVPERLHQARCAEAPPISRDSSTLRCSKRFTAVGEPYRTSVCDSIDEVMVLTTLTTKIAGRVVL